MEPQTAPDPLKEIREHMKTINDGVSVIRTNDTERAKQITQLSTQQNEVAARLSAVEKALLAKRVSLPGLEDEATKFRFTKAMRAMLLLRIPGMTEAQAWKDAGFEHEIYQETLKRTQGTENGPSGGFQLPIEIVQGFIDLTYANTCLDKAGLTKISGLKGPAIVQGLASGAVAYWHGEGKVPTVSSPTWQQKSLRPHEITTWMKIQNQLLMRASDNIEVRMRTVMAKALALKLDYAGLLGTGGENMPQGIATQTGVQDLNLGTNGARFSFDNVVDIEELLESANFSAQGMAIITSHKVKKLLKQQKIAQFSTDTAGQFVIFPMSDAKLQEALGYSLSCSQQIPTNGTKGSGTALTHLFAGLFAEMIAADWGTLELGVTGEATDSSGNSAWLQNQTWFKLNGSFDFGFYHADALVHSDEVATT